MTYLLTLDIIKAVEEIVNESVVMLTELFAIRKSLSHVASTLNLMMELNTEDGLFEI